uniref:Uncharacterized protein n=1 Tax=Globodera rostochiensis TaxID=31243 RepID=A0A914IEB4_GLORO
MPTKAIDNDRCKWAQIVPILKTCLENCQQINVGTNERLSNFMVHPSSISMPNFVHNNVSNPIRKCSQKHCPQCNATIFY